MEDASRTACPVHHCIAERAQKSRAVGPKRAEQPAGAERAAIMNNMAHLRGALPPGLRPGAAPPPPPPGMAPPPGIFAGRPRTGPGAPPPGVNVSREQLAAQAQFNRARAQPPSVLPGALSRAGGHGSLLAQYADPDGPAPPPMPKFVSAPPPKPSFLKKPPAGFGAPPKTQFHGAAPPPPDELRSQPVPQAKPPPPAAPKPTSKPTSWAAATAPPPPPKPSFQTQQAPPAVEPPAPEPEAVKSVFCTNLAWAIDDDVMRDHFKDVGDIVNIRWLEDRDTGKFRGMGVVSFADHATALKAVELKNESELLGRTFYCQLHKPKPKTITVGRAMADARAANRPVYDGEDPVAASLALEAEILRDMPDVKERVERRESRSASMGERPRTRGAALPRFDATSCMSGSDIAYVIRSQMRPLETMDSYTDDYYCHKWNQRRLVGGQSVGDAGSSLVAPVCISVRGIKE